MLHSSAQDMSHFPFLNIVPLYFFRDKNVLLTIEINIKLSIYTVMLCCFSYKGIVRMDGQPPCQPSTKKH